MLTLSINAMPPKLSSKAQEREGRLLIAIDALQKGHCPNPYAASLLYRVNYDTLRCRLNGRQSRQSGLANGRKLDDTEEQTLTEYILDLSGRVFPPRKWMVQDSAKMLIRLRGGTEVGKNWVDRYIERTPTVKLAQSKKYDYQRAKREDPKVIGEHFGLLQDIKAKYGIQDEDAYNMDEVGFLRGDIGSAKVVTAADGPRYHIQPGDRDWMTVIECIGAANQNVPAMVIAKGKVFQNIWFHTDACIPSDWVIAHSETGWSNDRLGYIWLTEVFDTATSVGNGPEQARA